MRMSSRRVSERAWDFESPDGRGDHDSVDCLRLVVCELASRVRSTIER